MQLPLVAFDARDAVAAELRGWGRYARELLAALQNEPPDGFELRAYTDGGFGPEVLFEQLKLPLALRRSRVAALHSPNCFLPLLRPCPAVATVHDLAWEAWPEDFAPVTRTKYRRLARLAARSAERIICPSTFTRDDLCRRWGIDETKVRVIPEAGALAFGGEEPPAEGPYLLAVGDLRRKKNLEALVRAFVRLCQIDGIPHRLVLAGVDSGSGPALRALAAGAPLELTGYVPDARLDALIRGAEVVVHPSLYEGFGLVVLEAMARGTPVLAARATALPETGGDAAVYFEPDDPDDLEQALRALLADDDGRARRSREGLARAAEFSWQRTARETAAVYRELL